MYVFHCIWYCDMRARSSCERNFRRNTCFSQHVPNLGTTSNTKTIFTIKPLVGLYIINRDRNKMHKLTCLHVARTLARWTQSSLINIYASTNKKGRILLLYPTVWTRTSWHSNIDRKSASHHMAQTKTTDMILITTNYLALYNANWNFNRIYVARPLRQTIYWELMYRGFIAAVVWNDNKVICSRCTLWMSGWCIWTWQWWEYWLIGNFLGFCKRRVGMMQGYFFLCWMELGML